MNLLTRLSVVAAAGAVLCGGALAADPKPVVKKKPVSQSRQQLKSDAKAIAAATEPVDVVISQTQIDIGMRVLTGSAQCEFNQHVDIDPIDGKPGLFKVGFNGRHYTMSPQETSTGAVRLEDKAGGAVWLQIPTKSMLLDTKVGQRLVDACTQAEQRAAVTAVESVNTNADSGIGITVK